MNGHFFMSKLYDIMSLKKEYKNMKLQLTLNSLALILCCGDLIPSSTQPISTQEWQEIEKKLKSAHKEPSMITGMSIDTLTQIIGLDEFTAHKIEKRQKLLPDLFYALQNLENQDIGVTTIYEEDYPASLRVLGTKMPLVISYIGDLSLSYGVNISVAGPQMMNKTMRHVTKEIMKKISKEGYTLVVGGSKGVEELALRTQLTNNGNAVLFVADHMFDKIRLYSKYIKQNKLVIMTANDPYALFDVTHALDKNLYICGMVFAQIVTGTHIGSGPVWFTSIQNIHSHWTRQLVYETLDYSGNIRLIEMGEAHFTDEDLKSEVTLAEILDNHETVIKKDDPSIDLMTIFAFIEDNHAYYKKISYYLYPTCIMYTYLYRNNLII